MILDALFCIAIYKPQYVLVCLYFTPELYVHVQCALANDACNILMISHRTPTLKFACRMKCSRDRVRVSASINLLYLFIFNKFFSFTHATHFGCFWFFFFANKSTTLQLCVLNAFFCFHFRRMFSFLYIFVAILMCACNVRIHLNYTLI